MKIALCVIAVVIQIAIGAFAHKCGYQAGKAETTLAYQHADIVSLNGLIATTEALTKVADQVSLQLTKSISDRQVADQQTTRELRNALSQTAHLRIGCLFDNSIMQKLLTAADAADQAATTGFISPMPTGTTPGQ